LPRAFGLDVLCYGRRGYPLKKIVYARTMKWIFAVIRVIDESMVNETVTGPGLTRTDRALREICWVKICRFVEGIKGFGIAGGLVMGESASKVLNR